MIFEFIVTLFGLLFIHALADFSLQTSPMARGKNRHTKPEFIPQGQKLVPVWQYWLGAHAFIHGGMIWIIFSLVKNNFFNFFVILVATNEVILHFIIDFIKCENKTNPNQDQLLHFICRIVYALLLILKI